MYDYLIEEGMTIAEITANYQKANNSDWLYPYYCAVAIDEEGALCQEPARAAVVFDERVIHVCDECLDAFLEALEPETAVGPGDEEPALETGSVRLHSL